MLEKHEVKGLTVGDVLVFSSWLPHSSGLIGHPYERYAFKVHYYSDRSVIDYDYLRQHLRDALRVSSEETHAGTATALFAAEKMLGASGTLVKFPLALYNRPAGERTKSGHRPCRVRSAARTAGARDSASPRRGDRCSWRGATGSRCAARPVGPRGRRPSAPSPPACVPPITSRSPDPGARSWVAPRPAEWSWRLVRGRSSHGRLRAKGEDGDDGVVEPPHVGVAVERLPVAAVAVLHHAERRRSARGSGAAAIRVASARAGWGRGDRGATPAPSRRSST